MVSTADKGAIWGGRASKEDDAQEKRWRAEEDLRHLEKAKEIENDKERHKMAKGMAKEKMKKMASVIGK